MKIHDFRKEYKQGELDEAVVPANPFALFADWFQQAKENPAIAEANCMTLATATKAGKPSARIVLLKEMNEVGFVFFTNYKSRKGEEIDENPQAQLLFFWDALEKQVRIEGRIEKISEEQSAEYFYSRPLESQYGAMVSPQSQPISKAQLSADFEAIKNQKPERPSYWGGYIIVPDYFEFWQGRPSRLHDRICYEKVAESWKIQRIAP